MSLERNLSQRHGWMHSLRMNSPCPLCWSIKQWINLKVTAVLKVTRKMIRSHTLKIIYYNGHYISASVRSQCFCSCLCVILERFFFLLNVTECQGVLVPVSIFFLNQKGNVSCIIVLFFNKKGKIMFISQILYQNVWFHKDKIEVKFVVLPLLVNKHAWLMITTSLQYNDELIKGWKENIR